MDLTWTIRLRVSISFFASGRNDPRFYHFHFLFFLRRIQITAIGDTGIRFGESSSGAHGLSKRNYAIRIWSIVPGAWPMVWYPLWKFAESRCLWKYFGLRAWIWFFEAVSIPWVQMFFFFFSFVNNSRPMIVHRCMKYIQINSCNWTNLVYMC